MRLIGYCIRCHKVKYIKVTTPTAGNVQTGVCDDCENRRA